MKKVSITAKTVELAVENALQQLNIGRDRAQVQVIVAPSKGFLGFGAKDAQVDVSVIENPLGDAELFLRELFVNMGFSIRISAESKDKEILINLSGDRVGMLIGKHGQTLDALQHLTNAVGNKYTNSPMRFVVDAENYRQRRQDAMIRNAVKQAEKAIALGREVRLEPMSAHDRKMIHTALQDRTDVRTESRGVDPDRAIIIVPSNFSSSKGHYHARNRRVSSTNMRSK